MKPTLSVTIITLNEEQNIGRAIQSVKWADEILVVDSGSTDRTVEIARHGGAKVITNAWPGYGQQKNFAQSQAAHDWVLNIDADEEVPAELATEIQQKLADVEAGRSKASAFYCPRKTFYLGRWIRHGGWYPNHLVRLANRKAARWSEPNLHEALETEGTVEGLRAPLHHYTFSSIQDQVLTNLKYSHYGSLDLKRKGKEGSLPLLLLKPIGKFLETFLVKRGFLDGLPGLIISVNAAHSMFLKYAYLLEPELTRDDLTSKGRRE
jgi:glycosyltransferase involved in cell wall biosynthesis